MEPFVLPERLGTIHIEDTAFAGASILVVQNVRVAIELRVLELLRAGRTKAEEVEAFDLFCKYALREWNLTHPVDGPLPCNREGFDMLDPSLQLAVIRGWYQLNNTVSGPLGSAPDAGSSSGEKPTPPSPAPES